MTWDALGRYLRFELPPGEALEKGGPPSRRGAAWKGVPFTEADYLKLDSILRDAGSLLGRQRLPDVARSQAKGELDALTGATPAAVRDAVVAGASLTCFNLWHWANGEVAAAIRERTCQQCGEALLLRFLASGQQHEVCFALEHLRLHKLFTPAAVSAVVSMLRGGDRERLDLCLSYLQAAEPDRERYFARLAESLASGSAEGRAYLLDRMAAGPPPPSAFLETVVAGLPGWSSYYEVHLLLRLAESGRPTPPFCAQVAKLLDSDNFFIARRAHTFLSGQESLDADTRTRLRAFRERAAREGRAL